MGQAEWVKAFRDLHERAKAGVLEARARVKYRVLRDKLADLFLSGQRVALLPGQRPRRALRVASALKVHVEFHSGSESAMTLQVSSGGFGALLARAPHLGEEVKVALRVPGGQPLQATARVVAVNQKSGNASASFQFVNVDKFAVERIEMFVFDTILRQLER